MALIPWEQIAATLGIGIGLLMFLITLFFAWMIIWKALALYKSARRKQVIWFIILMILNTAGILEIIYLLIYKGRRDK